MGSQIDSAKQILSSFAEQKSSGLTPPIDRDEVVAHATLSALVHHWPSHASTEILMLLAATSEVRQAEPSRWMTQRRIAIAKLARLLSS